MKVLGGRGPVRETLFRSAVAIRKIRASRSSTAAAKGSLPGCSFYNVLRRAMMRRSMPAPDTAMNPAEATAMMAAPDVTSQR